MTTHQAFSLSVLLAMLLLAPAAFGAGPSTAPATRPTKTRAEIEKLIADAGKNQPDWWDATPLKYPKTLDLTWKPGGKGWKPQENMGAYLWDIIDPNPSRWREGAKLVHHTYTVNKDNPAGQTSAARSLAKIYTELLCDYPRGAYWARKGAGGPGAEINLAECYFKMGSTEMAMEHLRKMGGDHTRNGQAVKLWADMGDLKTALAWADGLAKSGGATPAYLAAGDACRRHGKIAEAMQYYQKVLSAPAGGHRDDAVNKKRAQANLDAVKLYDALDLKKIPDGSYTGSSIGYVGPIETTVTVKANRIEKVEVTKHKEKQFYASLEEVPAQILKKQSVKGIDMTTGATVTSEAIVNGAAKALAGAQKP